MCTYPLIGNYGVPERKYWESKRIQVTGLVVSNYIDTPSHCQSVSTLASWLKREGIPALEIKDTRAIVKKLREQGVMLGKIAFGKENVPFVDPNLENLVARVSTRKVLKEGSGRKTITLVDCGAKRNITRSLLARKVRLLTVPWNFDIFKAGLRFDGLVISNGPGDPTAVRETIVTAKRALQKGIPTLGICLGNQVLALAAGGATYKMKFGHRGQNQPCMLNGSERSFLTTQNHGFAVGRVPKGFRAWFTNTNDGTNEGLLHRRKPFMSVQFHPEACPGPEDTAWIFDHFLKHV